MRLKNRSFWHWDEETDRNLSILAGTFFLELGNAKYVNPALQETF